QPARRGETVRHLADHRGPQAETFGSTGGGERAVTTCVTGHQVTERVRHRFGERLGHSGRQRGAQCVPHAARVLDRDVAFRTRDSYPDRTVGGLQFVQPSWCDPLRARLLRGEVTEETQQVSGFLHTAWLPFSITSL